MDRAVILAAGMGTRMRASESDASLSDGQSRVAATGVKALIPIPQPHLDAARPFLDYVLSGVADAGIHHVCLVVGPHQHELQRYYRELASDRIEVEFAIQHEPLGTAHALMAAAPFCGDEPFLLLNSDNHYPTSAYQALRDIDGAGLIGFDRQALADGGNISIERIDAFARINADEQGYLIDIVEKCSNHAGGSLVSMNCWRFGPAIHEACRKIDLSERGEFEIPDAVKYTIQHLDERYRVIESSSAVLDLSHQSDIQSVADVLSGVEVRL